MFLWFRATAYVAPVSETEALALDLPKSGRRVYTLSDRAGPLLTLGGQLAHR